MEREKIHEVQRTCDDLGVKHPHTHVFEPLVPSWWYCYGRFWNYLEVGHC